MSPLAEFLDILLHEGRAILRGHPGAPAFQDPDAARVLEHAFSSYRLGLAGPLLDFDAAVAQAAAAVVCNASWFQVSRNEPESELERLLTFPGPPRTPAEHISADLVLRFLPQVHRRAKAHNPSDRLTELVAEVLRRWPLSGVLADIEEAPLTPLGFGGHPGLLMLYAERFAKHEKAAWIPSGPGLEYCELVFGELGKKSPGQKEAP
jgi:MoxR-vWA-beta-propeller ternary system domain bpX4